VQPTYLDNRHSLEKRWVVVAGHFEHGREHHNDDARQHVIGRVNRPTGTHTEKRVEEMGRAMDYQRGEDQDDLCGLETLDALATKEKLLDVQFATKHWRMRRRHPVRHGRRRPFRGARYGRGDRRVKQSFLVRGNIVQIRQAVFLELHEICRVPLPGP
jgi:hypothetical protein